MMSSYFQTITALQLSQNKFTMARVEEEILKYIISGNIPFNQVENQHFRNIISHHLGLMARDTFAVPATGAGVERMFSKSRRVASWSRARLQAATIKETMLYKDFLVRNGKPLNEEQEREMKERKEKHKKAKRKQTFLPVASESGEEEEEEEEEALIKWEMEWWRKEGASIIIEYHFISSNLTYKIYDFFFRAFRTFRVEHRSSRWICSTRTRNFRSSNDSCSTRFFEQRFPVRLDSNFEHARSKRQVWPCHPDVPDQLITYGEYMFSFINHKAHAILVIQSPRTPMVFE
jgi:hypothetical protein